jgi:hypothetical protein
MGANLEVQIGPVAPPLQKAGHWARQEAGGPLQAFRQAKPLSLFEPNFKINC